MALSLSRLNGAAYSTLLPLLGLAMIGRQTPVTVITGNENSGTYTDVRSQINRLLTEPASSKINGTYSTKHLLDTYSAGVQHCQGLAWLIGGRFAISHDARSDRRALFVVQKDSSDSEMLNVGGGGHHPGGIQAAGKVVAVPIHKGGDATENQVVFMDCRNTSSPTEIPYLRIIGNTGCEAAGIAYDSKNACHWVITTNAAFGYGFSNASLWKSNGKSLFDFTCKFTKTNDFSVFGSEGGTQVLFDEKGVMYVAALYRVGPDMEEKLTRTSQGLTQTSEGREMIALSRIDNHNSDNPTATVILDKMLSDSGSNISYTPGWRWGGTIGKTPDGKLFALGVERLLTNGPAQQYAKTRFWFQAPGG